MEEQERLAAAFEQYRRHLLAVAYRMLGSLNEAEDAVQEAWLRLSRSDAGGIDNLGGWLTTVTSRICLDLLRSRKSRREDSWESHLPENIVSQEDRADPEQEAILADSVGIAMMVVLGKLKPAERITFVLHDIFHVPFSEISSIIGKSDAATRQLASRARRLVRGEKEVAEVEFAQQREMVQAFMAAAHRGDFAALIAALDPDVILRDDRQAAASRVARGAVHLANQVAGRAQRAAQLALVDGSVGIVVAPRGRLLYVLKFTIRENKITEVDLISEPHSTRALEIAVPERWVG